MIDFDINYPSLNQQKYIERAYEFYKSNNVSMIFKGSLAKDTATRHSGIDLIILGHMDELQIDEITTAYGNQVIIITHVIKLI